MVAPCTTSEEDLWLSRSHPTQCKVEHTYLKHGFAPERRDRNRTRHTKQER